MFESDYESIVAAAQTEEPVRICDFPREKEWAVLQASFSEMFPDVPPAEKQDCLGTEPRERILTEWAAGQIQTDVMNASTEYLQRMADDDLTAMPDWSVFDGSPIEIDERNRTDLYDGRFVSGGSLTQVIAYNTDQISASEVPQSWEECADPKYRGRVMADTRPFTQPALYDVWGEERFREWASGLAANEPFWVRGGPTALGLIAQGEAEFICGVQTHSTVRLLNEETDAPVDFVWPQEVPVLPSVLLSIAPEPRSPNASLLYAAWYVSEAGQRALGEANNGWASPFIEDTWMSDQMEARGATTHDPGWEYEEYRAKAADIMLEEWGFPQPEAE